MYYYLYVWKGLGFVIFTIHGRVQESWGPGSHNPPSPAKYLFYGISGGLKLSGGLGHPFSKVRVLFRLDASPLSKILYTPCNLFYLWMMFFHHVPVEVALTRGCVLTHVTGKQRLGVSKQMLL